MIKTYSKKLPLFLISGGVLLSLSIMACFWSNEPFYTGSMFTPDIINQPKNKPYFRTYVTPFYDGYNDYGPQVFNRENVKDWSKQFNGKVSEHTINYWLYEARESEIDSMQAVLQGKKLVLANKAAMYKLDFVSPKTKAVNFIEFVKFARINEGFMDFYSSSWNNETPINKGLAVTQLEKGLAVLKKTKDGFLKERYAFQLLRLYYFNGQYETAIAFAEQNERAFISETNLKWRALGYKAAALYKLKRYSEANYIYSKLFDVFEPLKRSAYLSFHLQGDTAWQQTLLLAKNNREKEALWQLMGLYTDEVRPMREILKLNPKSEFVDVLLVRAINREEEKLTASMAKSVFNGEIHLDADLLTFLNETAESGTGNSPACWNLAAAYLNYIAHDFKNGDLQLARAEKLCHNNKMQEDQYKLIRLIGRISRITRLDKQSEAAILPDIKDLFKHDNDTVEIFRSYFAKENVLERLREICLQNGEIEKGELINPGLKEHFDTTENIKKMIAYYFKPDHSDLEKYFASISAYSVKDYQDLLAIRYAQQDRLEESLALFKSIPNYERVLFGNPFTIHIRDCHDCDHSAPQKIAYSTTTFIAKMLEMKQIAKAKPAEAAQNYFLVANGFYNITYFGNARFFNSSNIYPGFQDYGEETAGEAIVDQALKYYLLAKQCSRDPEFKAKCTYMASKCELNKTYITSSKQAMANYVETTYFDTLKFNYSKTKYYAELIKECSYFREYLAHSH